MKKYFLLILLAVFAVSCSKKVEVTGKVTGGSPLERIEFTEASGVATLPLVNMGVDKNGNFSGSFEAPKDGMYVLDYAGKQNLIYLKKGQNLNISGEAGLFPNEFKIEGDAKNNNEFLQNIQEFMRTYTQNLNMQEMMQKDEKSFLAAIKKIQTDIEKEIDQQAEATKADAEVVEWKKNDVKVGILSVLPQFSMFKKQMEGNPGFKVSKAFTDYENSLQTDKDALVKEHPAYRNYLLSKMQEDFQKYATANAKENTTTGELFSNYIKKREDLSQTIKDYLMSFVLSSELNPDATKEQQEKLNKIINEDIKDASIKEDLKKVQFAISGPKTGESAPDFSLIKQDDKKVSVSDFKGKPTVLMNYASWSPYIQESTLPILKQMINFYKGKANFVFVNFDDSKEQFKKTSTALFKGVDGTNVYAMDGLNGKFAKDYGIYGFKLKPTYVIIDKDGKVASKTIFNLGAGDFVTTLDKLTGMKAPDLTPKASLQNDILANPKTEAPADSAAAK